MSAALKIIFAGTPEFAAIALQTLLNSREVVCAVLTQPDRPAGRGRKLSTSPIKKLALEAGVPVYQPETLKQDQIQQQLRELNADLMVVVAYGLILPVQVLSIPRFGCINIHASLLPRWRGAAPIQRALLAGDAQTGITVMQMNRGLDSGDILYREACEIKVNDTAASLHDRLVQLGAASLMSTLIQIKNNTVTKTGQDERLASYAAKIDKHEAKINWANSAVILERTVRAFNPWPIAYTTFGDGKRVRIWQAEINSAPYTISQESQPGMVIYSGREGIDVLTGQGILRLLQVQPANSRPMPVSDFLNAYPVRKNDLLGQAGHH